LTQNDIRFIVCHQNITFVKTKITIISKSNNDALIFDYDYKTDIAVPKLRFRSSVNDQILIMDIDLKRTRKSHKKRFEDFQNNLYGLL
jgi:hypothetical protein